jgi:hypothetical protein
MTTWDHSVWPGRSSCKIVVYVAIERQEVPLEIIKTYVTV